VSDGAGGFFGMERMSKRAIFRGLGLLMLAALAGPSYMPATR